MEKKLKMSVHSGCRGLQAVQPIPPLHQHFKRTDVLPGFDCEAELAATTGEKQFPKLYHLRSDELRQEVNDISTLSLM